jgi:hypothetical protein
MRSACGFAPFGNIKAIGWSTFTCSMHAIRSRSA